MKKTLYHGSTPIRHQHETPRGEFVEAASRIWYRITHYDRMDPFLVSVTNPGDIWMFLSTTGGITAGRRSTDAALFPYLTVDRVADAGHHTGAYTVMVVKRGSKHFLWVPLEWAKPRVYDCTRSFCKTVQGDAVMFEEENHTLNIVFRTGWEASPGFGVHRFVSVRNTGDSPLDIQILDGIRNVLPAGVPARMQSAFSNLIDAYKRSEADPGTSLAVFSLSATPTDLAEPSECLQATTVWSYGLTGGGLLLSEIQVPAFMAGQSVLSESDIKGRRGAYLRYTDLELKSGDTNEWGFCAEVEQSSAAVNNLHSRLAEDASVLADSLHGDILSSRSRLAAVLERNDAVQRVQSRESESHHVANVLFNIMRGGYFVDGYGVDVSDFAGFVRSWNRDAFNRHDRELKMLAPSMDIAGLRAWATQTGDPVLRRLAYEYLPLTFSRRHGDPSRPWNEFYIQTHDSNGNPVIGYQGNWRDIFQNWEALCLSYPDYFPSVIFKFINATTADGHNPYRISHTGINWEIPEPENPWSNIGYWGDHQIVYLSRLMEHAQSFAPGSLAEFLDEPVFVYANVPYRIRPFDDLLEDPRDSIVFDHAGNDATERRVETTGADGRLVLDQDGEPVRATMIEKLLVLLLAKTGNFLSGGGIWLNTQRPEWNDANNALAGWGLSVVTVSYLIRFVDLVAELLSDAGSGVFTLHKEVSEWLQLSSQALQEVMPTDVSSPPVRYRLLRRVGSAASDYRERFYLNGFSSRAGISRAAVEQYLSAFRSHLVHTLETSRNRDGSFASYQMLEIRGCEAHVRPLYLMLEGQVAGISSGLLNPEDIPDLIDTLRSGPLYRADQHSYMLYPNRALPGFLEKNRIEGADAERLEVLARPESDWAHILERDKNGVRHFNRTFRNARDLEAACEHLNLAERAGLLELFEKTFNHASFTGRSGTFFAYEGLGSIYWHMVSKLLLAVQELLIKAVMDNRPAAVISALKSRYVDIRSGLGFNKDPAAYGAVPTDPYSHTPWGQGAKQPGMTGQVKEEIVARFAELGLVVRKAQIMFLPELILDDQWRKESGDFEFTCCGVVFTVARSGGYGIEIERAGGESVKIPSLNIPPDHSAEIFHRTGRVTAVRVSVQGIE